LFILVVCLYAGQQSFERITLTFFILVVCLYAGQQNFKNNYERLFILVVCLCAGQQSFKHITMKNFILAGQQSYKHITMKDFFIHVLLFCLYAGQQNFKHISMKNLFILVVCQYAGQQSFKNILYSWNSKLRSRMVRYSGCFDVILKSRIILLYIFNVNKIACLDLQSFDIFSHSMSIPSPNTTFRTLRLIHGSKSISQLSFAEVRKAVWVACVTQQ